MMLVVSRLEADVSGWVGLRSGRRVARAALRPGQWAPRSGRTQRTRNLRIAGLLSMRWLPIASATLAGAAFLVATGGGHSVRHVEPLLRQIDRSAADVGLGLTHITIRGHRMATDGEIFAAMQLDKSRSLIGFDSNASRTRIEQLPWVAQAHIRRSFPHRV